MEPKLTPVQPAPQPTPPSESKKSLPKLPLIIAAVILVATLVTGGAYLLNQKSNNKVACTQEAKLCPDGSSVGRTGPKCEFTKCPAITLTPTIDVSNWKTYINTKAGVEFRYPATWTLKSEPDWTLTAFLENHPFEIIPQSEPPLTSIQVAFNEQGNLGERTFREKTLAEGQQDIETLFDKTTIKVKHLSIGEKDAIQISGQGTGMLNGYLEYTLIQMDNKLLRVSLVNQTFENIYQQLLLTFKFTNQNQQGVLKIPEFGVQVVLSDEIKDAYYINTTASKGYVYLKVHSLDFEPQCLKDTSSTAALSKVGKDEINPMSKKKYSDSFKGTIIGNYFYYIDLAQYICAQTLEGKTKLDKVRTAFTNAEVTQ